MPVYLTKGDYMMSICFTGHREINDDINVLSQRLYQKLESAVMYGIYDFYCGGAIGWDTLAALTVIKLRKKYPHIKLHLVLPCPPDEQSHGWTKHQRSILYKTISAADTVEQVCPHYSCDCMKKRNARLLEHADFCLCYFDPDNYKSGTGQTVRMAHRKSIKLFNFWNYKSLSTT